MPTLAVTNFNTVCATIGGFVGLFGLVSYLLKERFYLSEALISLLVGIAFSHGTGFLKPLDYALGDQENLAMITLYFTRLVLGVQLVLAGVQLPSKYLIREWRPLVWLLGPGMTGMWICSALLVWALVPNLSFLHALAVAACVTPTDPVLSNSIVKGKFADKNIPTELQRIIIAESGANDGLGYPFLFLALYIIKYVGSGGAGQPGGARLAMGYWFGETWGYTIILSVVYGAVVGWIAKDLLHYAEEKKFVDRESFLVFAIALALFITGTCGMIGSDDVLACFIAGNSFTYDDWFRLETLDDSLQPTIDMLLNLSIFLWFGAVCPWYTFVHNDVIPIYRLIPLGILILLLRRTPIVTLLAPKIHQLETKRQTFFVGFFGPIGVSAVFYLYISLDFLNQVTVDGVQREDAARLADVFKVVVWFLAICSIVVHGLSVPLGKLGYHLPRTISSRVMSGISTSSTDNDADGDADGDADNTRRRRRRRGSDSNLPFRIQAPLSQANQQTQQTQLRQRGTMPKDGRANKNGNANGKERTAPVREVFRIGGTAIVSPPPSPGLSPRTGGIDVEMGAIRPSAISGAEGDVEAVAASENTSEHEAEEASLAAKRDAVVPRDFGIKSVPG